MSQLATGAFFFAMRSCEHLAVSGERRTKLLQLQNIRFFKKNKGMGSKVLQVMVGRNYVDYSRKDTVIEREGSSFESITKAMMAMTALMIC